MKRRELLRASVFTGAVAALTPALSVAKPEQDAARNSDQASELTPAQRGVDASKDLSAPGWKPLFLDEHQNETLIILSDMIIPATDTPGAKEAQVNRYIDLVMAAETHENQRAFLSNLAYIDGESMRLYKSAFRYLPREDQDELLHAPWPTPTPVAPGLEIPRNTDVGHTHFEQLKTHIGIAYYNSQIGMKELGWDGAFAHGEFQGCDHSEGKH